jgi:hypothetical protein
VYNKEISGENATELSAIVAKNEIDEGAENSKLKQILEDELYSSNQKESEQVVDGIVSEILQ